MPFTIRSMGLYLVIDTDAGLIVMWDKKTSVFIKLSPNFKVSFEAMQHRPAILNLLCYYLLKEKMKAQWNKRLYVKEM